MEVDKVMPTDWPDVFLVLGKAAIQLAGVALVLWHSADSFDATEYHALGELGAVAVLGGRALDSVFGALDSRGKQ